MDGTQPSWLTQIWRRLSARPPEPPESGYLTLIPLSDARLRPTRTRLVICTLLLFTLVAICGVFFLVPRGVTVGTIKVHSSTMAFNTTTLMYTIVVSAEIPVYNSNYVEVEVGGHLSVSFYDQAAGVTELLPVYVAPRSAPQVLEVQVDASNVPRKYMQTIYTQCFNFPQKLVFFLLGELTANYLGSQYMLPAIDTYFILDCSVSGTNARPT